VIQSSVSFSKQASNRNLGSQAYYQGFDRV
jgi:hypothetical protein